MTIAPSLLSPDGDALRRTGAAADFEGLLIADMMKTVRGEDGDSTFDAAMGLAENEFARAIAGSGGIGLHKLIEQGLIEKGLATSRPAESPSLHQS